MLDGYLVTGIEHLIYSEMEFPSDQFAVANWERLKQEVLKLNNSDVSEMVQPDGFLNHSEGKRLVRPLLGSIKRELQMVGFTFKDE